MNSHFQSSDTTSTLSGFSFDDNGFAGSRSCDPIQATLPRSMIVSNGTDQVTISILPDSTKLGWKSALLLDDRYHHPNMSAARIVGTTIGSMMMYESIRSVDVPSATTPLGLRTSSSWQPPRASNESMAPQRRAPAVGDRPLNRGRGLNALPAKDSNDLAILWPPEAVLRPRLDHADARVRIGGEPVGNYAARQTRSDSDIVVHAMRSPGGGEHPLFIRDEVCRPPSSNRGVPWRNACKRGTAPSIEVRTPLG